MNYSLSFLLISTCLLCACSKPQPKAAAEAGQQNAAASASQALQALSASAESAVSTDAAASTEVFPKVTATAYRYTLAQPRACVPVKQEDNAIVCTKAEVHSLHTNQAWLNQRLEQLIARDYADHIQQPTAEQRLLNQTSAEGRDDETKNTEYRLSDQFGPLIQIEVDGNWVSGNNFTTGPDYYWFDMRSKKQIEFSSMLISGQKERLKRKLWEQYNALSEQPDSEVQSMSYSDFYLILNAKFNSDGSVTFNYGRNDSAAYIADPIELTLKNMDGLIKEQYAKYLPHHK